MWFEELTGFTEQDADQVRQMMTYHDGLLRSNIDGREFKTGSLETASLAQLEQLSHSIQTTRNRDNLPIHISEVIADVQSLHCDAKNAGALFQVASQFNLLEMVNPNITPDLGVSNYQYDRTQGPACAMACGAGLIYRNYFVPVNGKPGQAADRQLNTLDEFEQQLLVQVNRHCEQQFDSLWLMKNGYALPTNAQLTAINATLSQLSNEAIEKLIGYIKIGVQYNTEVTLKSSGHCVTQAYCSAMPVAYTELPAPLWQPLASLILQAAYRATLAAAVINAEKTGNNHVYLTLLGGGAFGNSVDWITKAISQAINKFDNSGLQVKIVSFGRSKPELMWLLTV